MATQRNIGQKLLLAIGLPGLVVAVAGVGALWLRADAAMDNSMHDEATAIADLVSNTFTLGHNAGEDAHPSVSVMMRANWKTFRHVEQLRILNTQGIVRWSRRPAEQGKPPPEGAILTTERLAEDRRQNSRTIEVFRPLGGPACISCHAEAVSGVGILQLRTRKPRLHEDMTEAFQLGLFGLMVFSLVIGGATALSLHFFLRRPLKKLSRVMRRAEDGDFLVRADTRRQDEIGQLALAFNQMLAKITSLKAQEIDTHRDLEQAQMELALKKELEVTHAKVASRLNELETLYDVARALTSTLELPELLGRITLQVSERLRIPQFSIMLLAEEGHLEVKGAYPPGLGTEGLTFRVGEGACGRAAELKRSVYIPDVSVDAIYQRRNGDKLERGSLLSVPMIHTGSVLGVLNFQRPDPAAFGAEELDLLRAVADQAAVAVKNALLHAETVTLSITDPLTGVPNRRHLFTRLEMEIARANRFGNQLSTLMIDIDHFKQLNDHSGHRAGDQVLRRVADLLKGIVRKVDTIARYGGEEFMLLLPQVSKAEALEVAEKLRNAVHSSPIEEGSRQPLGAITVSIGVSNLPVDATELEGLVDCADSALYASKRGGRDRVTPYAAGMELHPGRERGPHAAKRRTGEFPIVLPPAAGGSKPV